MILIGVKDGKLHPLRDYGAGDWRFVPEEEADVWRREVAGTYNAHLVHSFLEVKEAMERGTLPMRAEHCGTGDVDDIAMGSSMNFKQLRELKRTVRYGSGLPFVQSEKDGRSGTSIPAETLEEILVDAIIARVVTIAAIVACLVCLAIAVLR